VPAVGVVSAPALARRWWAATGHGAWVQHDGGDARPLRVSAVAALDDATLSDNNLQTWDQYGYLDRLVDLSRAVGRTRAFGDLWSYMLLAEGASDVAGEFDVKAWDVAALVPIITEAGGRVTTATGTERLDELGVVANNGARHDVVLDRLRG